MITNVKVKRCWPLFHAWGDVVYHFVRADVDDTIWAVRTCRCTKCPASKSFTFAIRKSAVPSGAYIHNTRSQLP